MKSALSVQPTISLAIALALPSVICLGACNGSVAIGNQAVDAHGDVASDVTSATGGASNLGTGGQSSTGGIGSGGSTPTGGVSGSGGTHASGGGPGSGGTSASASGGVPGSGGVPASGGIPGSGGAANHDAGSDAATGCPSQLPLSSTACSGSLTCIYGQSTCCGQTYSGWTCKCQYGSFLCSQTVECNFICPEDAGAPTDTAMDSPLDGDSTAADTGSPGGACGATGDPACAAGAYCAWPDKVCGSRTHGACANIPTAACDALANPVCGCDGNNYPSACDAAKAGVDVSTTASCTPPTGTFRCGWSYCQHGAQYCSATVGGAVTNPGSYACQALPAACGATASCTCVTGTTGPSCTQSADGDVTVTLFAP